MTVITDEKQERPWLFQKGDPRINRKGRPPKTQENVIKELAEVLMEHKVPVPQSVKKRLKLSASEVTILERILLDWALSLSAKKQEMFIERIFGKVPVRNINENSGFDWTQYVSKFTDAELERIKRGENPLEILIGKIPDVDN